MANNPESLTPDAALLEEVDARKCQAGDTRDMLCAEWFPHSQEKWCLKCRLAQSLRASLDRERERQKRPKVTTPRCTQCGSERLGYDPGEVPGQGVDYCESCGQAQIPESFYRIRDLEARAEQAERERNALTAELQRLKEQTPTCMACGEYLTRQAGQ